MYECTRGLEDSVYHNTAPHEQPRGLEYKSRCKNSWARFSPRAPHVKRAAWVLLRDEGIIPRMFVRMAFLGTTCCPFWLLLRGSIYRDELEFLFLRTRLYTVRSYYWSEQNETEKPSDEPPTDREHRPGARADQAHRSRGAPSATAAFRWWSLFGSVVCFYNSSNILK